MGSSEEKYNRGSMPEPDPVENRLPSMQDFPTLKKPPRIHLSTAITVMFAAGLLIWANLIPYQAESFWDKKVESEVDGQGWPFNYWPPKHDAMYVNGVNPVAIAVNILAGGFILFLIGALCEFIIRIKKPDQS